MIINFYFFKKMSSEKESTDKDISKKIVEKIKNNGVKMKPAYCFIFTSFLWFGAGAIVFFFALLLLAFGIHYFNEYEFLGLLIVGHFSIWMTIPILFIMGSIFLIYLSSRFYRRGRICCRHEEWMLLTAIGLVVFFGIFILAGLEGFEKWRDGIENHRIMEKIIPSGQSFWSNNSNKRISGKVVEIDGDYILIEKDLNCLQKVETKNCGCEIPKMGEKVKVFGFPDVQYFQAKKIWLEN